MISIAGVLVSAIVAFAVPGSLSVDSPTGSYTIVNTYPLLQYYGLFGICIQDDATDIIWITDWDTGDNIAVDMTTGVPTGDTWGLSNGVDPLDQAYLEISGGSNQFLVGNWDESSIYVYEDGSYVRKINGPTASGWDEVFGVAVGNGFIYVSDPFGAQQMAWGTYTGVESSVTWNYVTMPEITGLAVWSDYLFASSRTANVENLFIFDLNPDGSFDTDPVWSAQFDDTLPYGADGSIDYDGEYLWVSPDSEGMWQLDIDWDPSSALERSTWAGIKTSF